MRILTVNSGSSSLKINLIGPGDSVIASASSGPGTDPVTALRKFLASVGAVEAIAHRIVHGGPVIRQATVLDDEVRRNLQAAAAMAPQHVEAALRLVDVTRELVRAPQVVCVDTAFHAELPAHASTYAVPVEWRSLGLRRYGFHGLSYAWASARCAQLLKRPLGELQVVMTHIGAGVSACAVRGGRSVDTSMGFTPLEGAVMATRSGSFDPGAMLWLQRFHDISAAEMSALLEHESGLRALCGKADMRDVERGASVGEPRCAAALDVFVHTLCRSIAGVASSLDRLDALVFTGGIGEHSHLIRSRVCRRLSILALPALSPAPSNGDAVVGQHDGQPSIVVVAAREDVQMAREARQVLLGDRDATLAPSE